MEWGLAEEAAQAARFLAHQGLAFEQALLAVLETRPWEAGVVLDADGFRPRDGEGWLCPIRAGAALSDLGIARPMRLAKLLRPLLLIPFAARLDAPVALSCGEFRVRLCGGMIACEAAATLAALPDRAELVELALAAAMPVRAQPLRDGIAVDQAAWQGLQAFEARTYVPASLHSRLSGAGAGAIDND
jgi:hypothetical protein